MANITINDKKNKLDDILKSFGSILIAFSGGVDSTYLLKSALDNLGQEKVLAVSAASDTYPQDEIDQAKKIAKGLGANHLIIKTEEIHDNNYVKNDKNRCYYCKIELFSKLFKLAEDKGFKYVADGSNKDDDLDYRPGRKAALEFKVNSPLRDALLTKEEIRLLSKAKGLVTWDKPQVACLASRIPYGSKITLERLNRINAAENFIREQGIRQVRVRDLDVYARIEIEKEDFSNFMSLDLDSINTKLKQLGYIYISLDLEGYRSGSLNEVF